MSYILDALKRADAERERGAVPGLHARPHTDSTAAQSGAARRPLWLGLALGLALAALLGGVATALWWPERSPVPVPIEGPGPALTNGTGGAPTTGPATSVAIAPAPAGNTPALPPVPNTGLAASTPTLPTAAGASTTASAGAGGAGAVPSVVAESAMRPPTPIKMPERPALEPVTVPAARASAVPAPAPTPPAKAPDTATVAALSATPGSAATIPLLADLPEELRRQIPPIAITGAVYSDNPGQRLLLMNGQVLTQGSTAAPDLALEEIRERSAVFSFRGTRFRVAH